MDPMNDGPALWRPAGRIRIVRRPTEWSYTIELDGVYEDSALTKWGAKRIARKVRRKLNGRKKVIWEETP